jgi:hypothetical protein
LAPEYGFPTDETDGIVTGNDEAVRGLVRFLLRW